ncbi:MAG: Ribose ABC transport system, permease protein RbsC, partial [uncultured Thermomicrobiales bacterium]
VDFEPLGRLRRVPGGCPRAWQGRRRHPAAGGAGGAGRPGRLRGRPLRRQLLRSLQRLHRVPHQQLLLHGHRPRDGVRDHDRRHRPLGRLGRGDGGGGSGAAQPPGNPAGAARRGRDRACRRGDQRVPDRPVPSPALRRHPGDAAGGAGDGAGALEQRAGDGRLRRRLPEPGGTGDRPGLDGAGAGAGHRLGGTVPARHGAAQPDPLRPPCLGDRRQRGGGPVGRAPDRADAGRRLRDERCPGRAGRGLSGGNLLLRGADRRPRLGAVGDRGCRRRRHAADRRRRIGRRHPGRGPPARADLQRAQLRARLRHLRDQPVLGERDPGRLPPDRRRLPEPAGPPARGAERL